MENTNGKKVAKSGAGLILLLEHMNCNLYWNGEKDNGEKSVRELIIRLNAKLRAKDLGQFNVLWQSNVKN